MHETLKARPVSGEIMTDDAPAAPPPAADPRRAASPIIDAEFETVNPSGSRAPGGLSPAPTTRQERPPGLEVLARAGKSQKPNRQPGGPLFWMAGITLVAAAFWVSGGHAFFRTGPFPSFFATASQLKIASVETRVDRFDGRAILFIDGEAVNESARTIAVPPLSISVEGNDGATTRYFLGTRDRRIGPNERFAFSSRLEVPREGVKTVSVSFEERE